MGQSWVTRCSPSACLSWATSLAAVMTVSTLMPSRSVTHMAVLTVSYSHGCPHGQLLTWLSSRSVTHMAVLTVSYSHGCPHGQLLTWLSSRSVTHMAVLTVSYSHGCPHGQLLTWLSSRSVTHMAVLLNSHESLTRGFVQDNILASHTSFWWTRRCSFIYTQAS